ncbi:MAG: DUF481 domain-containing protein [Gemmatimonadaceae bacterium]|nr:DUF481 domain-containing protein [Gemmatimonadaceae bacterium]
MEVSGSFLYGNTEQTIFSSRGGLSRADSLWGIRVDGRFLIGVASINGTRVMDRRSWLVSTSIDRHPEDTHTQFVLASVERSFELRIDQRVNAGVGYKYVIECDTLYKLDLSVAVLGELNALPQPVAGQPGPAPVVRSELTRLSTRLRYRNQFTDRLNFDHVTWYRPELLAPARFLASSLTAVQYQLTKVAGLRLSFQNEYDSLAQGRGARSNHNGQILIGVNSRF